MRPLRRTANSTESAPSTHSPQLDWAGKAPPSLHAVDWRLAAMTGLGKAPFPKLPDDVANHLIQGDNLALLQGLRESGWAGRVALVYVDPPFDSGADYHRTVRTRGRKTGPEKQLAYRDVWAAGDYLQFMYERLLVIKDLLSETGSIFLHCDFRRVHHLRCLLDEIFGPERFRNQIVWAYGGGARGAKAVAGQFPRNHDVILWYGKGPTVPYAPIQIERRVPLAEAKSAGYRQGDDGQWFKTAPRGDYTDASIARLTAEGRIYRTRTGSVRIKYPLRQDATHVLEDVMVGDVWTDIPDAMHAGRRERFDYPTRKPVALLERLILAATKPGDLVLDAFCGSGTTLVAAERLQRRWIGLDANPVAIEVAARRVLAAAVDGQPAHAVCLWQAVPTISDDAERVTVAIQAEANAITLAITGFRPPACDNEAKSTDWRAWVDAVYIDPAFDGPVFRRTMCDVPAVRERQVSGVYALPVDQVGAVIGVQVVDVFGSVWTTTVTTPGASAKGKARSRHHL